MEIKPNIVIMGGSFNPPTIAHLRIMQTALDTLRAEAGYFVPVSFPYLKRKMIRAGTGHLCLPDTVRLAMLRAMCAEDGQLRVDEGDLNEPFSVTVQTMEHFQTLFPQARIWFILGEDKLELLEAMVRKDAFLPRFGTVIFSRSGGELAENLPKYELIWANREAIIMIQPPAGAEGVSSTAIRAHLFEPDAVADMLHPRVLEILRTLRSTDFPEEILEFKGNWAFLSNDYPVEIEWEGLTFPSAEAAFQASKYREAKDRQVFQRLKPQNIKQKGSQITPWPGWEEQTDSIMREILRMKFTQHPELKERLLATGERRLIAGNKSKKIGPWGKNLTLWEGENRLGTMLMDLRDTLRKEEIT